MRLTTATLLTSREKIPLPSLSTIPTLPFKTNHIFFYYFVNFIVLYANSHSTRLLAATTLRNVLGTKNLAEVLSERETISHTMQSSLDEATDPWGVKVERVEM